jgi:hypothetical protein
LRIDKNFLTWLQQGSHGVSCDAKTRSSPQNPQEQLPIAATGKRFSCKRGWRVVSWLCTRQRRCVLWWSRRCHGFL